MMLVLHFCLMRLVLPGIPYKSKFSNFPKFNYVVLKSSLVWPSLILHTACNTFFTCYGEKCERAMLRLFPFFQKGNWGGRWTCPGCSPRNRASLCTRVARSMDKCWKRTSTPQVASSGVCCVKSYVSKRKKCWYEIWGLVRFGGKLHHEKSCNHTNPPKHTHVSYVLKRNFLHNTPQWRACENSV